MVYLSLSFRVKLDVEALNMVESIGNVTRHRRAPIVVKTSDGYLVRYVQVVSGESLAHAYQANLADLAVKLGLPVCPLCRRHEFLKHSDESLLKRDDAEPWEKDLAKGKIDPHTFELTVIKNCVVEDVGGFLYPQLTVKRTSKFQVSYLVPASEELEAVALEAQFHVRYAEEKEQQQIYWVETGSGVYTALFNLDIDGIGYTSSVRKEKVVDDKERLKRIKAAIQAAQLTFSNMLMGAKRTRFHPLWEITSAVLTLSHPVAFTVSAGHRRNYIVSTVERARKQLDSLKKLGVEEDITIYYYIGNDKGVVEEPASGATKVELFEELFSKAIEYVEERVK